MPVAPPPDDEWGFWPLVQSLVDWVGDALSFPDADEDVLRDVLATAWDDLSKQADDVAKAAGTQVPIIATNWPDYAGGAFNAPVSKFAGADPGGAGATAAAAHGIADSVRQYAVEVKYTKEQIVWEVAANLVFYAATFAGGPAGVAAGAIARFLISRGTARAVSGLLESFAARAAATTFPKLLGAPMTLKELPKELAIGMAKEAADELFATIPPLINNDLLTTDFGRRQMQQAALGGALGDPVSKIVGKPFHAAGNLVGRGLDRVGAANWLQRQGSTFVSAFGANAISSPISSKMANDVLDGNWKGLLDGRGYVQSIGDNWVGSGIHGVLRANGVAGAHSIGQVVTTNLAKHAGLDPATLSPSAQLAPATAPATATATATAPAAATAPDAANSVTPSAAGRGATVNADAPTGASGSHGAASGHHSQTATEAPPPVRGVPHSVAHHDSTPIRSGDADNTFNPTHQDASTPPLTSDAHPLDAQSNQSAAPLTPLHSAPPAPPGPQAVPVAPTGVQAAPVATHAAPVTPAPPAASIPPAGSAPAGNPAAPAAPGGSAQTGSPAPAQAGPAANAQAANASADETSDDGTKSPEDSAVVLALAPQDITADSGKPEGQTGTKGPTDDNPPPPPPRLNSGDEADDHNDNHQPSPPASDTGSPEVLRGVARSLLWFSGSGRLTPGWGAVEKQVHAALADPDVLAAAEIESVERVAENRYVVTPREGAPFDLIVRAARVDGGHPGKFVVRADGKGPATVTVSDRAKGPVVARTMANLLHQLANAGRAGPDALRPGTQPRVDTRLSREDGGRLAEARLLRQQGETTAAYRVIRRQNIQNEIRALMEHLGVAQGQEDARWRRTVAGSDRALLNHLTRGWTAGDNRARTRVYIAKELVLVGVPATATSVGIAVTDNIATALGLGVPAVAIAVLSGIAQRWLDGHKNAANSETQGARLKAVTKRNPGIMGQLESDPYGLAGKPVEDLDPSTLRTSNWRYRLRHIAPAVVGVGLATALTGGAPIASALYFGASALIKPLTEMFVDGRKSELKILRREELLRQFATDPTRYQNELIAFLAQLSDRLTEATDALARTQADPRSIGNPAIVAAELAGRGADAARLAVPRAANPNETDPTALARELDNFGEVLIVGLLNNLFAGLATAGVTAVVERQSDQAADASYSYNLEVADSAESRALFDAVQEQVTKLVQLVELAERLGAQDPAKARLFDRILERLRQAPPPTRPGTTLPAAPTPGPAPDPANDRDTALPFWVQSLYTIPPLVTLGVVNVADAVLGMDPAWLTNSVIGATAMLLTAPVARWVANRQDARHARHSAEADNKRAIDQRQLADKLGVLLFLGNLREQELQARIDVLQPGAGPLQSRAHDLYRAAELFFRVRPASADFTDRVRAAVRAARLTINPQPGESFHERQDRHLALDRIEQYADRVDDAIESVRRDDPGAKAVLRAARADLVAALKAHAAEVADGRGALPDLAAVDPATGERLTGDPLTRARAAADEAWRRMLGEPDTTPYRTRRVIALARVRAALDTLSQELAAGDRARVKLAINDLTRTTNAFKALQRKAGVAGDVTILTGELSRQVKDFIQRPDGNAAALGEFVANGPIQDHALLTDRIVRAVADRGLLRHAGVAAIDPIGDGTTVEVTTREGERIVLRFSTGPVADGHPAEYRRTGGTEYAVVRVSERIAPDDVARAVVHEIRELARLSAGEHTAAAHDQGRVGELLYLDEELQVAEHFEGPDPVRRRLYQEKMQELYDDLRLSDAERRARLDPAVHDVVQRNDLGTAAALSPYPGPVRLSEYQWTVHVVPRHGHGSPAVGTKFHRDFDQSRANLEALAREVVDRAPIPIETDGLSGNHRHEYDFGPGRVIGASGTGKVVIWVDPAGNVRSIYPEDATR